jgi:hypothetical protein
MNKSLTYPITILIVLLNISSLINAQEDELTILTSWMIGSFSSKDQAENDSSYYDISLEVARIWKDRKDGNWLYVEQAISSDKNNPYRQRVYQLIKDLGIIQSIVYTIPNPKRFIGSYKEENPLSNLSPDSLEKRKGCTVYIKKIYDNMFTGETKPNTCFSKLRGASYATSQVTITPYYLKSWDRGFDSSGIQVWGAEKGGYFFKRIVTN